MARLALSGWELNDIQMEPAGLLPCGSGSLAGGATPTFDQVIVRSGAFAGKCVTTTGGTTAASRWFLNPTTAASHSYWVRCYFYVPALPSSPVNLLAIERSSPLTFVIAATLNAGGTITGPNGGTSAAVSAGGWFRLEFQFNTDVSGIWIYQSARLNGTTYDSGAQSLGGVGTSVYMGLVDTPTAPGLPASFTCYQDDFGMNDDQGSSQNTWLGDGKVVLLKPTSDSARGANWVAGAGGTGSLFAAIDNTPPVGVALASATNTSQIKNVSKDTTGNYDAALATYASAGIQSIDTVNVVVPMWNISGLANTMAILLVSNPIANGGVETATTAGAVAPGTYPSNWVWQSPSAQWVYAPTVVLATSPVIRVGKRVSSTSDSECDAMSMYVDYTPGVPPPFSSQQGEIHSDPTSLDVITRVSVARSAFYCIGKKWSRRAGLVVPA